MCVAILVEGLAWQSTAFATFISANSVTATSHFRNGTGTVELKEKEGLIDGLGLDNLALGASALHHGNLGAANPRPFWHAGVPTLGASTGVGALAANVAAQHLDFGFDTAVDLTGIHIWQYSQWGNATTPGLNLPRGVNAFDLYVSSTTAGEDFVQVGSTQNLAIGTAGATAAAFSQAVQTFPLVASNVRRVRLDILTAHSGATNEFVALDEVHFEAVPEPTGLALIALASGGGIAARRRTRWQLR
jgi:hypothetical protein